MPKVTPKKAPLRRTFLKEWREYRNLSQEAAAERIGIDRSHLSRIESGSNPYNQPFLESSAAVYRCEPADLLMRDPKDKSAIWTLLESVRDAAPATQKQIQAVVETILKTSI